MLGACKYYLHTGEANRRMKGFWKIRRDSGMKIDQRVHVAANFDRHFVSWRQRWSEIADANKMSYPALTI